MSLLQLLASFFPPHLAPSYLIALAGPVLETVALALGAMALAVCVSLPLVVAAALGCGRNARAIPEPPADFSDLAALAPTGMLKLATPS